MVCDPPFMDAIGPQAALNVPKRHRWSSTSIAYRGCAKHDAFQTALVLRPGRTSQDGFDYYLNTIGTASKIFFFAHINFIQTTIQGPHIDSYDPFA